MKKGVEQMFMLDIESTGVDKDRDDIIEIGIIEMFKHGYYWLLTGKQIRLVLHTDKQPESAFSKENMSNLFKEANEAPMLSPQQVRSKLLEFFEWCGCTGAKDVFFCGWNAGMFDVPFLVKKGYLHESGYDLDPNDSSKDIITGDFHYRIYELAGAIQLMSDILEFSPTLVREMAEESCPTGHLPEGQRHDAIYDCFRQVNILNGLIKLGRQ